MKSKKDMKKIDVNNDVWTRLHTLKEKLKYKKWSAVVAWLLDHHSLQEKNIQKPDHEKLLQGVLSEKTWNRIIQIKESHGFNSISRVIDHLLDAYNLVQAGERHQKLEEKTSLNEIYDHIQQLKPSQKLEEEPVSSKASIVDIAPVSKDCDHTDDTCKTEWLCCPVCHHSVPLIVEVGKVGNPLQKHEAGIKFKNVNGVLQRRFSGPGDDYLPFQVRTGHDTIIEESMAISTLKRLDKALFDDFTNTIKNAAHRFLGTAWWK